MGGRSFDWQVTSAGGREEILVIAARAPIPILERETSRFPQARPGAPVRYGEVAPQAVARLRGIGGLEPTGQVNPPTIDRLADLVGDVKRLPDYSRNSWMWYIKLDNSGP